MENRSHALVAGIFVILFAMLTALAIWWLGQNDERTTTYILETRRNVTGLNVQATVRYRGIRAGKVFRIDTDPADPRVIQVFIALDSRFDLTEGSSAQLGYQGMTGLAYVQIEDDGSRPGPLRSGPDGIARLALKPGLLDTLGEKAGDIVTQVGNISQRLGKALDERNLDKLARTLDNVATASESMRDGMKELPRLLAALRETLSPANLARLQNILAHVEKTAGETAPLTAEMRELVRSMTAMSHRLDRLASETGAELNATTLPRANSLLRDVSTNARQLSQLLEKLENNPQLLIFGRDPPRPGPGEAGFIVPGKESP